MQEIIVVGGGPAGMMAAAAAGVQGKRVMLLEHNTKAGRKLAATGNGKCNYTNAFQEKACYRSCRPDLAWGIVRQFDENAVIRYMQSMGIYPRERGGYYYPCSEEASSVVEAFLLEMKKQKVIIRTGEHVREVEATGKGFVVHTDRGDYPCSRVVLAGGGLSGQNLGNDGSCYKIAEKFGHKITRLSPALSGIRCREKYFKKLSGVRVKAAASLWADGRILASEKGEIQLAAYGISGIPVMQMSRFAAFALLEKKKVQVSIDLFPALSEEALEGILKEQQERNGFKTWEEAYHGLLPGKLLWVLLEESGTAPAMCLGNTKPGTIRRFAKLLKSWTLEANQVNGFEKSQVTAGGVDLSQVDEMTLESKMQPGLYFAGELLDVDGTCGGYNLQWAFSSGYLAGTAAGR